MKLKERLPFSCNSIAEASSSQAEFLAEAKDAEGIQECYIQIFLAHAECALPGCVDTLDVHHMRSPVHRYDVFIRLMAEKANEIKVAGS